MGRLAVVVEERVVFRFYVRKKQGGHVLIFLVFRAHISPT